jgi:hypothetical protein
MPIDPNTGQEQQSVQSLLDLMPQGGAQADPYGGKTLAQIVLGGLPFNMNVGTDGRPMGGGGDFDANAWLDRPATNENVSDAIGRGGRYRPEVAQTLQSSGAEGGFFSIPGSQVGGIAEASIPWGYYDDPRKESPAPGLAGMSTNNWRLLPKGFQDPRWAMRAGHILDRSLADKPGVYVAQHGSPAHNPNAPLSSPATNLGAGGHGYPLSWGYTFGPRGSFFPGQIEPWIPEGGPGGMGTGIY